MLWFIEQGERKGLPTGPSQTTTHLKFLGCSTSKWYGISSGAEAVDGGWDLQLLTAAISHWIRGMRDKFPCQEAGSCCGERVAKAMAPLLAKCLVGRGLWNLGSTPGKRGQAMSCSKVDRPA